MKVRLTPEAVDDIEEALFWSAARFGRVAARRYQGLIGTAIREISADLDLPGSRRVPGLQEEIRLYHLAYSRKRAVVEGGSVKRPRHFIAYRPTAQGGVEILRLLHDRMDLDRRL